MASPLFRKCIVDADILFKILGYLVKSGVITPTNFILICVIYYTWKTSSEMSERRVKKEYDARQEKELFQKQLQNSELTLVSLRNMVSDFCKKYDEYNRLADQRVKRHSNEISNIKHDYELLRSDVSKLNSQITELRSNVVNWELMKRIQQQIDILCMSGKGEDLMMATSQTIKSMIDEKKKGSVCELKEVNR